MTTSSPISRRSLLGAGVATGLGATVAGCLDLPAAAAATLTLVGSTVVLDQSDLGYQRSHYPRLKKVDDSYLLFFQDGQIGWNIATVRSTDLVTWAAPQPLFTSVPINGGADDRCYSTADAVLLADGDLLAFASFRSNHGYSTQMQEDGIALRRSTDGGLSWGTEQVVYTGANWEPSALQLANGDIELYFTHIAPALAEGVLDSSGVAMIRSCDGGHTWTPSVTAAPWAATRIVQQYRDTTADGDVRMTDQMASAIQLADGSRAMAVESWLSDLSYTISLAHSGGTWTALAADQVGPSDRQDNVHSGAAPYLVSLSGVTLLGYNDPSGHYVVRIGDPSARTFGDPQQVLPQPGFWGHLEVDGADTVIASMPWVTDDAAKIMIQRLILTT